MNAVELRVPLDPISFVKVEIGAVSVQRNRPHVVSVGMSLQTVIVGEDVAAGSVVGLEVRRGAADDVILDQIPARQVIERDPVALSRVGKAPGVVTVIGSNCASVTEI